MNIRRFLALLTLLVLVLPGMTPPAQALYGAEDQVEETDLRRLEPDPVGERTDGTPIDDIWSDVAQEVDDAQDRRLPEDEQFDTGVEALDRRQREVQAFINDGFQQVDGGRSLASTLLKNLIPPAPIEVYHDDIEDADGDGVADMDSQHGRIGDWRVIQGTGDGGWVIDPTAASSGAAGYTSADRSGGTYTLNARTSLVAPELDLRTGLAHQMFGDVAPYDGLWDFFLDEVLIPTSGDSPWDQPYYNLKFDMRYNLGSNGDDLQLFILTTPPGEDLQCGADCIPLFPDPLSGDSTALPGSDPDGWVEVTVELTPLAEQRVWLVAQTRTSEFGDPAEYFTQSFFNRIDFFGAQFDNFRLNTPAPPTSLQVHEILAPDEVPGSSSTGNPAVSPSQQFFVETVVRNTGLTSVRFTLEAGIGPQDLDEEDPVALGESHRKQLPGDGGSFLLDPGEALPVRVPFDPIGVDVENLEAWVRVNRTDGTERQDLSSVPDIPDRLEGPQGVGVNTPARKDDLGPDADPADDMQTLTFDALELFGLSFTTPTPSSNQVKIGEPLTLRSTVRNSGTVPESFEVYAHPVDVNEAKRLVAEGKAILNALDPSADAVHHELIPQHQRVRTVELEPGEEEELSWDLDTSRQGQYRLLINTTGFDGPRADDLGSAPEAYRAAFAKTPLQIDGSLSDPLWGGATALPVQFGRAGETPILQGEVRILNNATHLILGVRVDDTTGDASNEGFTTNQNRDALRVLIDDMADGQQGTEDGIMHNAVWEDGEGPRWTDLQYVGMDGRDSVWGPDASQTGSALRVFCAQDACATAPDAHYEYEIVRPLASDDLKAGQGDDLGLMFFVMDGTTDPINQLPLPFPAVAQTRDGAGLAVPDGNISDEMRSWMRVRLAEPGAASSGDRAISVGVGVGVGAPPVFHEGLEDGCPGGWGFFEEFRNGNDRLTRQVVDARNTRVIDGWMCGHYRNEDRVLFYEGTHPDSDCRVVPCPQSYIHGATGDVNNWQIAWNPVLVSPPIDMGGVQDPVLYINHQYANGIRISDSSPSVDSPRTGGAGGSITITSLQWVEVQELDPATGEWGPGTFLVPVDGYDTEESTGIADPRREPGGRRVFNLGNNPTQCSPEGPIINPHSRDCGWWWPSGKNEMTELGAGINSGGHLHGSPWKTDAVRINGYHPQGVDIDGQETRPGVVVDTRDKTVRFLFHFDRGYYSHVGITAAGGLEDYTVTKRFQEKIEEDMGWRIGGLRILDGKDRLADLAITDMTVDAPYDIDALGIGPGTTVDVEVTVRNQGIERSPVGTLRLLAQDVAASDLPTVCELNKILGSLGKDEETTITFECDVDVPPSHRGSAKFTAELVDFPDDELPFNDRFETREPLDIRSSPDLAVAVDVNPRLATKETPRTLDLVVHNRGNVPVDGFDVVYRMDDRDGGSHEPNGRWTMAGPIDVAESRRLAVEAIPSTELRFEPRSDGLFMYSGWVDGVVGDVDPDNDKNIATFAARPAIYHNAFDGRPRATADLVDGDVSFSDPVWAYTADDSVRAGDPRNGEIPTLTDASMRLPTIDLTGATEASISLRHQYKLEEGYDGAALEISVDNGTTWTILRPTPDPGQGLPEGYPDTVLTGTSPFLEGQAQRRAVAFTGDSRDLPGADPKDGTVVTEFDLRNAPVLQEEVPLIDFPVTVQDADGNGFATIEDPSQLKQHSIQVDGHQERFFYHDSWTTSTEPLPPVDAFWYVEDATYNKIHPHSGTKMWWSGSPDKFDETDVDIVDTTLSLPLDLTNVPDDDGQGRVFITWWDWRSGWKDTDILERDEKRTGTGGVFDVHIGRLDGTTEVRGYMAEAVESRDDGWTKRSLDLSRYIGEEVDVVFDYRGAQASAPVKNARVSSNLGWFIDDLNVTSYRLNSEQQLVLPEPLLPTDTLDTLPSHACGGDGAAGHTVGNYSVAWLPPDEGGSQGSSTCWQLVGRGPSGPTGWHVEEAVSPDGDTVPAWRLSSDNDQGYPHNMDSRLITPMVDLEAFLDDSIRFGFMHRYQFEGEQLPEYVFPFDSGFVEVQVFNPDTGKWGPWQQLTATYPPPQDIAASITSNSVASPDNLDGTFIRPIDEVRFQQTGYTGLYGTCPGRSMPSLGPDLPRHPGYCYMDQTLGLNRPDGRHMETAYVFSGNSGGWQDTSWDITHLVDQKVRFGFHSVTNPAYAGADPLEGWTVTDLSITGEAFKGRPVDLRLRVGTDDTLPKGEWIVHEMSLAGDLYKRNLAVEGETLPVIVEPIPGGSTLLPGRIVNQGTAGRATLALAITATDEADGSRIDDIRLADQDLPLVNDEDVDIGGLDVVYGPFSLDTVGRPGGTLPFEVEVPTPQQGKAIRVEARVLEDIGEDIVQPDGSVQHDTLFGEPNDEVVGNTIHAWTVEGDGTPRIGPIDPEDDQPGQVAVTVGDSSGGAWPVRLTVASVNDGTGQTPVETDWRIYPLGSPDDAWSPVTSENASVLLGPGERVRSTADFLVPVGSEGFYRAEATVEPDGAPSYTLGVDFPVGRSSVYWSQNFDPASPGELDDWAIFGEDPELTRWSATRVPGQLSWGADPFGALGFCDQGACVSIPPQFTESFAQTPRVDLTQALNGQAEVTLVHRADFGPRGAGGHIDFTVLEDSGSSNYVPRECNDPGRDSFPLGLPTGGIGHDGRLQVGDGNQLASYQSVGQLGAPVVSLYDLAQQPAWCPSQPGVTYVGSDFAIQLHSMASNPAAQFIASGWQVDSLAVSSGGVDLGPITDPVTRERELHMQRGTEKNFLVELTNNGAGHEWFGLEVVTDEFTDADEWITLGQDRIRLPPGSTGQVRMTVAVPNDATTTIHPARLDAFLVADDAVRQTQELLVNVESSPRPNLIVQMRPDGEIKDVYEFEKGDVIPLHATVFNRGKAWSQDVQLEFFLEDEQGRQRVIDSVAIEPLCHEETEECPAGSSFKSTVTVEWRVDEDLGDYVLGARVDPQQTALESDRRDNRYAVAARILPLQVPDVAVTDLTLHGVSSGGFIEEGALLKAEAVIKNEGVVPANDVRVNILADSLELTSQTIPVLNPQQEVIVSASRLASGDREMVIRATALIASGQDADASNDRKSQIIRVRTHDLSLNISGEVPEVTPGGKGFVVFDVANAGNSVEELDVQFSMEPGWEAEHRPQPLRVAPGGQTLLIVQFAVPGDASSGTHNLGVTVAPRSAPLLRASADVPVNISVVPSEPVFQVAHLAAQPGPAMVWFEGNNTANHPMNVTVHAELPEGWTLDGDDVTRLIPNSSRTWPMQIHIPNGTAPGEYPVEWTVRSTDGRWNVGVQSNVTVAEEILIDARWGEIKGSQEHLGFTEYEVDLQVTNQGNRPLSLDMVAKNLPQGATLVAPGRIGIAESTARQVPLLFQVRDGSLLPLTGYLDIMVSSTTGNQEVVLKTLPVPPLDDLPDLRIRSFDINGSGEVLQGRPVEFILTVENVGKNMSGETDLLLFVDGRLANITKVPDITPGTKFQLNTTWVANTTGSHSLSVVLDASGGVTEWREYDNSAVKSFEVQEAPAADSIRHRLPGFGLVGALGAIFLLAVLHRRRQT